MVTALLEGVLRDDVAWRPFATIVAVGLAPVLLWRRTHPLVCVVVGFGTGMALGLASQLVGIPGGGLNTMLYVLVLVYALVRWGSGRQIVIGLTVVLVAAVFSIATDYTGPAELFGGLAVLAAAAAGGGGVPLPRWRRRRRAERRSATAPRAGAGRWTRSAARSASASRGSCTTWSPTTSRRSRCRRRRAGRWPGSDPKQGSRRWRPSKGKHPRRSRRCGRWSGCCATERRRSTPPIPALPTWCPSPAATRYRSSTWRCRMTWTNFRSRSTRRSTGWRRRR